MPWFHPRSLLDKVFEVSLLIKGIDGLIELLTGLGIWILTPEKLSRWVIRLAQNELKADPSNFIGHYFLHLGQKDAHDTGVFVIAYLVSHGILKLIIVFGLSRNLWWAYPFSFVVLTLFILYQVYAILTHFTLSMFLLTLFDLFVLALVWREYQKYKAYHGHPEAQKERVA
jgi:uncharacterized membrane protein